MKIFSKNEETDRKVSDILLGYATKSGGELKRAVDMLTFDPRDFFECHGFTEEEIEELLPKAANFRKELIKEYKYNRPTFQIGDTPKSEIDEELLNAANGDVFICEFILSQINMYLADEQRTKPGKVTALIGNDVSTVRFGGLKAMGFNRMKSNFISKNESLCKAIIGIISDKTVSSKVEVEDTETEAEVEVEVEEISAVPVERETGTLSKRLFANQQLVADFLSYYQQMSEIFSQEEISKIVLDDKLQQFVTLCGQIA